MSKRQPPRPPHPIRDDARAPGASVAGVVTPLLNGDAATVERLLMVSDVADVLQVSQRSVRRWIADGALPIVQLGRAVRVRPADLERLIQTGVEN